jgi:hypothetical protein
VTPRSGVSCARLGSVSCIGRARGDAHLQRAHCKIKVCTIYVSTVTSSYRDCTNSLHTRPCVQALPRVFDREKVTSAPLDQNSGPVPPHHFSHITQITIIHPAYLKPVCRVLRGSGSASCDASLVVFNDPTSGMTPHVRIAMQTCRRSAAVEPAQLTFLQQEPCPRSAAISASSI